MDNKLRGVRRQPTPGLWQSTPPPFVGRRVHLEQLTRLLGEVRTGQPWVVFLQGEAGMGKTRLLDEIRTRALQQGYATAASRCYEDFHAPYLPFIEALRHLWDQLISGEELVPESGLERLHRLLQHEVVPALAPTAMPSERAEQDKIGLCLAMTRALLGLAQRQPLLLTLDNLHWADTSTLDLITYLVYMVAEQSRQAPVPLCILAAHRPVALETPLGRLLERLPREAVCHTIELAGLDEADMIALVQGLGLQRPAPRLLHTLEEITRGSPLFIHEILRYLAQRQALREHQGQTDTTLRATDLRLPSQVTEALLARTGQLSRGSQETLSLAALLGDEFTLQRLSAVSGLMDTDVLTRLEEAVQQRLLLSEGQAFQFAHPLLRQALYHLPSVAQRQRLHGQIAQTLCGLAATDHAVSSLEIAHHLMQAGPLAAVAAVVEHVRQAGDYAFALCDWRYAAQAYTTVVQVAAAADLLPDAELALLYYRAGVACGRDGDVVRSDAYHEQAIAAYRRVGDLHGQAQAVIYKTLRLASAAYGPGVDTQPLSTLLEEAGEEHPSLRGQIAVALAEIHWTRGQGAQAAAMAQHGLAIGQQLGEWALCARSSFTLGLVQQRHLHLNEALAHYAQARHYAHQAEDRYLDGWTVQRMGPPLLGLGRLEEVREVAAEAYDIAAQTQNWRDYAITLSALAAVEVALGAFDAAERYAQEALALATRYQAAFSGMFVPFDLACAHAMRGAWSAAEAALDLMLRPESLFAPLHPLFPTCAQVYQHLLRVYAPDGAIPAMAAPSWRDVLVPATCDHMTLSLCCALVELSAHHADPMRAAQLYALLTPVVARGVVFSRGWGFLTPRILGLAATLTGQWEQAETHFQAALALATEVGAEPERGRTYLDYAQMLLARAQEHDHVQAHEFLHKATLILGRLGMTPFVHRATQYAAALQAPRLLAHTVPVEYRDSFSAEEVDWLTQCVRNNTIFLG